MPPHAKDPSALFVDALALPGPEAGGEPLILHQHERVRYRMSDTIAPSHAKPDTKHDPFSRILLPAYILPSLSSRKNCLAGSSALHTLPGAPQLLPRCFYSIALCIISIPAHLQREYLTENLAIMVTKGANRERV
jgi:hypothetical protein